jgi:CheY-like chemotaxis protein
MPELNGVPHILVVDDDPDILATIEHILRVEGYQVVSARNGQEALALLDSVRPNLIILDLMMPVMDGWEFRTRLRDHPAAPTPVLVVSADRDIHRKASALEADAYIAKPFDIDDFLRAVNRFAPLT